MSDVGPHKSECLRRHLGNLFLALLELAGEGPGKSSQEGCAGELGSEFGSCARGSEHNPGRLQTWPSDASMTWWS